MKTITSSLLVLLSLMVLLGLLLAGCSSIRSARRSVGPTVFPAEGAAVTATVGRDKLTLSNNSSDTIYFRIFPTEILPVIEWAPCIAPEVCPAEETIDPGSESQIPLRNIVEDSAESITVFYWRFLDKRPGASVPPMALEEFLIELP